MVLLVLVVAVALAFDFTNGFHDTANYVATWVGTRALSPRPAVLISAAANLAGAFVTTAVATTVGKGLIDTGLATEQTVLAALFGAITWNLFTWRAGLPSSSTHALIGGLIGAALVQSGTAGVEWSGVWHKVIVPGAVSPVIGFAAQIAAGTTLYAGTRFGFPISTTHVVSGSVMGAGATRRLSAVRWGVAGNIVFAWLLTLPAAAVVAAILYHPVNWIF